MSRQYRQQYGDQKGGIVFGLNGDILFSEGTTVPTDATAGYAPGALYLKRAGTIGAQLYFNEGSRTSSLFHVVSTGGLDLSTLTATAAEINRACKNSTRPVAGGASLTVTQALHDGKTILLDTATGTAVTLPIMSGSGARYRFVCTITTAGGTTVVTATAAHLFGGVWMNTDTAAGTLFTAVAATNAGGSTTITLDGTTKGGRKGDWFEIEDVAAGIGIVRGSLNGSGTEATPFA